jgi:predicted nucleotide-binding protein
VLQELESTPTTAKGPPDQGSTTERVGVEARRNAATGASIYPGGSRQNRLVDPEQRQQLVTKLIERSEPTLRSLFAAHGLGEAFDSPKAGWGKRQRVENALAAAKAQGRLQQILTTLARFEAQPEDPDSGRSADEDRRSQRDASWPEVILQMAVAAEDGGSELTLHEVAAATGLEIQEAARHLLALQDDDLIDLVTNPGDDEIKSAHVTRVKASGRRAAATPRPFDAVVESLDEDPGTVPSIFVVHGHGSRPPEVARVIETCTTGVDVVVLKEQRSRGQTIIQKFESHAPRANFAVVVATADDLGRAVGDKDLKPRARQNVVLELGYFIGRLGIAHVAVLRESEVELPGDIDGLIYITLDAGGAWKLELAKELQAGGIDVDFNKIP